MNQRSERTDDTERAFDLPRGRYESCVAYLEDLTNDDVAVCARCGWLAEAHEGHGGATVVTLTVRQVARVRRAS